MSFLDRRLILSLLPYLCRKFLVAALLIFTCGGAVAIQSATDLQIPRKIDSYGATACDDAMARLDYFAGQLQNEPDSFGYIVVYPERTGLAGRYRSYVDFAKEYLHLTRGVASERLTTLRGEYRDTLTTELWIASKNASLPLARPAPEANNDHARKFDEGFADYSAHEGRRELWTYDLCGLGAVYFRAFADQLRAEPNSRGLIIIHLEYNKPAGRARTMARLLRDQMVKENGVETGRLVIRPGRRRRVPGVELWIVPR